MKAILIVRQVITIKIGDRELPGTFKVASDWEGMIKLESSSPQETIIIESPDRPSNQFDALPKWLGGNKPNQEPTVVDATIIKCAPDYMTAGIPEAKRK